MLILLRLLPTGINKHIQYSDPSGHSWKSFWKKYGDWISLLGRAIVTGEWRHFAVVTIAIAANILLPGAGTFSSNLFINIGFHALRGAAIGAVTGGISAEIMGGEFSEGARLGAITGGAFGTIQGVTSSEQFSNFMAGNGFKSDAAVDRYHSGQPTNGTNDGNPNKALIVDKGKCASGIREIDDPGVRGEMLKAYNESLERGSEQGGVILRNQKGGLSVERYPQGNCNADGCTPIGWRPGGVADFHTHFHTKGVFGPDYQMAVTTTNIHGLQNHYVVDAESIKSFTPNEPGKWKHVWKWSGE